mmetsp:Transcript_7075/g.8186  ORF Transcript_7075/g.8186 Transcript_7075/m.8186 type:complete len:184 (+) Transcript_7075:52-603(+)
MLLSVTKRGMVQTALGSIFYLLNDGKIPSANTDTSNSNIAGKTPILCFHMSPRSSDEYLEVLPLLAAGTSPIGDDGTTTTEQDAISGRVVIAFDIPGYGASENPPRSCTIDEISDVILMAADSILQELTTIGDERESGGSSSSSSSSEKLSERRSKALRILKSRIHPDKHPHCKRATYLFQNV